MNRVDILPHLSFATPPPLAARMGLVDVETSLGPPPDGFPVVQAATVGVAWWYLPGRRGALGCRVPAVPVKESMCDAVDLP